MGFRKRIAACKGSAGNHCLSRFGKDGALKSSIRNIGEPLSGE
jgi:hypothetical protein